MHNDVNLLIGLKIQDMWDQLAENFQNIGIGIYEIYYNQNRRLVHEIGANSYPQFIAVVAKRTIKYKGDISERSIRDFMSTILPHHLITPVSIHTFYKQHFLRNSTLKLWNVRLEISIQNDLVI